MQSHDEDKPRRTDANTATRAQINPRMKSDSQQTFNLSPLSQVRCWQRPRYLTKTHIGPQERDKLFVSAVNAANLVSHHFKFRSTAALRGSEKMCVHEMRGEREVERGSGREREGGRRRASPTVREGGTGDKIT